MAGTSPAMTIRGMPANSNRQKRRDFFEGRYAHEIAAEFNGARGCGGKRAWGIIVFAGDFGHPAAFADIPELVVSEPRIPLGAAEVEPARARAAQLVDRGPAQRIARAQGERLVAGRAERNEDAIPGADDDGADHRLALMAREEEAHAELLARLFGDRGQILDAVMIVELFAREHVLVERNKIRNAVLEAGLLDDEFVRYLFQIRAPLRAERSKLLLFRK